MSKSNKPISAAEEIQRNWPAIIWRLMVSLIPFILLFYYFTYEPAVEDSVSKAPAVIADTSGVDSLD